LQLIALEEDLKLLGKAPLAMALLLCSNIIRNSPERGLGNRENPVTPPPTEFPRHETILVDPVRGTTLE
jgi:hypothetical protein